MALPFRARASLVLALPLAALAVACSSAQTDSDSTGSGVTDVDAPVSYVGTSVVHALTQASNLRPLEHKTWEVSSGNTLSDNWLLPTFGSEWWGEKITQLPTSTDCKAGDDRCDPDFLMRTCDTDDDCAQTPNGGSCQPYGPTVTEDGQEPKKLCVGYAEWYEQAYYDALVSAESYVDITSLWLPADRFVPAIRNGLTRVAKRGTPLTVRILSGDASDVLMMSSIHTGDAMTALTRDLPPDAPIKLYIAEHSASLLSWNHSKIIATDGKFALVGGHNMHTADYQLKDPVSDLSMRLTGPAAAATHKYANQVWDVACKRGNIHGFAMKTFPAGMPCPAPIVPAVSLHGDGDTTVISAGRLGAVKDNASDAAILAMIDAAKTSVAMSQEDILGGRIPKTNFAVAPAPADLIEHLAQAIARGVDVYLVISNVDGGLFTTSYSHGWTGEETVEQVADAIVDKHKDLFPADADIKGILCDKFHLATLRLSDLDRWPDGKVFSNHSKFLMIDTQAFYVGSQNLYSSDLAEFGFIVDSHEMAQQANDTFWAPLWRYSSRVAVSGSDAQTCALRH